MMRQCLAALIGLLVAAPAGAQTAVRLSVGATGGSAIVSDVLGEAVSLTPAPGPTASLLIAHPVGEGYRALLEVRGTRSTLRADDAGETSDIAPVTTIAVLGLIEGRLTGSVSWELGAGIVSYRPSEKSGVFAQGGPSPWMLAAGLAWRRPLGGMTLVAGARYDFHQFTTRQLESRGYTQQQTVHRGGVSVGLERSF